MSVRLAIRMRAPHICALAVLALALPASAQEALPAQAVEPPAESAESAPPPQRAPKYLNLRYDEDFSYLDKPEGSYEEDLFDPIKWIHLTDDLTLTLGGSFRARFESETNRSLGMYGHGHDAFFLTGRDELGDDVSVGPAVADVVIVVVTVPKAESGFVLRSQNGERHAGGLDRPSPSTHVKVLGCKPIRRDSARFSGLGEGRGAEVNVQTILQRSRIRFRLTRG